MTPLLTALSSLRDASRSNSVAFSTSPVCAASLNLRTAVFSDDLTALLRMRRFSFCRLRLIWDLMFATRRPRPGSSGLVGSRERGPPRHRVVRDVPDYQGCRDPAKAGYVAGQPRRSASHRSVTPPVHRWWVLRAGEAPVSPSPAETR